MKEREITCPKCNKKHPISDMRYFKTVNNLMCKDCLNKIQTTIPERTEEEVKDANLKTRYKCIKCEHIFTLKAKFNKQCPFCGSKDLVEKKWNSDLDNLINESSDNQYNN